MLAAPAERRLGRPRGVASYSSHARRAGCAPQPVLAPPPASQVTDITARLKAQIAKGLQELSCSK